MGRMAMMCIAVCALAPVICYFPGGAIAAMTLDQMKSLKGAAQLEITVDHLFRSCGLPAAIVDHGPADGAKQRINWHGVDMRLSAMEWDAVYGMQQRKPGNAEGWVNEGKFDDRCISGLSQLLLHAKGHVGVLIVTKKAQGFGYITVYHEPKNHYKVHKVIGVRAAPARSLPVSTLVGRYGQPDEILKLPGARDNFRYWVVTRRDHRPESLYAIDFEVDNGISKTYVISTSGVDFVQQRLDSLLKQWERDYVLD
jgi:hypothetical protein